jgi:hypothetical protein
MVAEVAEMVWVGIMISQGSRVIYVPRHAHEDITHPDCEHGKVSSINEAGTVFVRFDGQIGDTNPGCHIRDLVEEL